jgi:hypothetical protein
LTRTKRQLMAIVDDGCAWERSGHFSWLANVGTTTSLDGPTSGNKWTSRARAITGCRSVHRAFAIWLCSTRSRCRRMERGAHAQCSKAPVDLRWGLVWQGWSSRRAGNTWAGNNTGLSHDRLLTVTAARSALLPLSITYISALSPLCLSPPNQCRAPRPPP